MWDIRVPDQVLKGPINFRFKQQDARQVSKPANKSTVSVEEIFEERTMWSRCVNEMKFYRLLHPWLNGTELCTFTRKQASLEHGGLNYPRVVERCHQTVWSSSLCFLGSLQSALSFISIEVVTWQLTRRARLHVRTKQLVRFLLVNRKLSGTQNTTVPKIKARSIFNSIYIYIF